MKTDKDTPTRKNLYFLCDIRTHIGFVSWYFTYIVIPVVHIIKPIYSHLLSIKP
jgi:hypothetical protein